jgi:hypothetical protein
MSQTRPRKAFVETQFPDRSRPLWRACQVFLGSNAVFGFGLFPNILPAAAIFASEGIGIVAFARALAKQRLLAKCII